jgi:hypothetical protein
VLAVLAGATSYRGIVTFLAIRAHHVRDRIPREDDSRSRTKPGIFARLRSFALNRLRANGVGANGVGHVSGAPYANALRLDRLLAYTVT